MVEVPTRNLSDRKIYGGLVFKFQFEDNIERLAWRYMGK
jgi:hypothetical protein